MAKIAIFLGANESEELQNDIENLVTFEKSLGEVRKKV